MNELIKKMILLIEEAKTVRRIIDSPHNLRTGAGKDSINIDPNAEIFGIPMNIFRTRIITSLKEYETWLNNQIKTVAQDIVNY